MKTSKCRSCGAKIYWAFTEKKKRIPIDIEPVTSIKRGSMLLRQVDGELHVERTMNGKESFDEPDLWSEIVERNFYQSHFASCPNAKGHRNG